MTAWTLPAPVRIALLVVLLAAAALNLGLTFLRVEPEWPLTPWEPALVNEGWRWAHGQPVYTPDRASHLYGPLFTVLLGGLQKIFGFSLPAFRACFAVVGFGACLWLARLLVPGPGQLGPWAAAAVLLSALNLQTGLSFPLSWPDMPALFALVAAWALLVRGERVGAGAAVVASLLCAGAALCKQTAAVGGLALAALWVLSPGWRARAGWWLFLPLLTTVTAFAALVWLAPAAFHQAFIVPSGIELRLDRLVDGLLYLVREHPVAWIALAVAVWRGRSEPGPELRAWLGLGLLLAAASLVPYAKAGGYYNSLLPILLFLSAVVIRLLATRGVDPTAPPPAVVWILIAGLGASAMFGALPALRLLRMAQGDATYATWIERLRKLPGRVVSPEEPSLALRSTGYSGKSLYFELDAAAVAGNWPSEPPPRIVQEVAEARWLVTVAGSYPTLLTPAWLQSRGWRPIRPPEGEQSVYTLWARPTPP